MRGWDWYKDLLGTEVGGWSKNAGGAQPNCTSCTLAEVVTEDGAFPGSQAFDRIWAVRDELFNFRTPPRAKIHPLLTLTDASYAATLGGGPGNQATNAVPGYGPDHPIAWCQNFEGGRVYANVLMHNWENSYDPRFQRSLLQGIEWAAGAVPGNCVTYREMKSDIAEAQHSGAIAQAAAEDASALVDRAYTRYLQKNYAAAIADIDALRALTETSAGKPAVRSALSAKARELKDWMQVLNRGRDLMMHALDRRSPDVLTGGVYHVKSSALRD